MSSVTEVLAVFSGLLDVKLLRKYIYEYFSKYGADYPILKKELLIKGSIKTLNGGTRGNSVVLAGNFNYFEDFAFNEFLDWLQLKKDISCFCVCLLEPREMMFIHKTGEYKNYERKTRI